MKTRFLLLLLVTATFAVPSTRLSAQSKGKSVALETLGMQGGIMLYNTYCLVGSMHDGYLEKAWEKSMVSDILDEQIGMMNKMSTQYQDLLESGYLTDEDSLFVLKMKKCCGLLKDEATYLKSWVNYESSESKDSYDKARNDAWALITELLGIEEGK